MIILKIKINKFYKVKNTNNKKIYLFFSKISYTLIL